MVLEDVVEYDVTPDGKRVSSCVFLHCMVQNYDLYSSCAIQLVPLVAFSQLQERHLDQILLNGNNIAVMVPGGKPEDS